MVNDVIETSEDVMKSDKVTKNHVIEKQSAHSRDVSRELTDNK